MNSITKVLNGGVVVLFSLFSVSGFANESLANARAKDKLNEATRHYQKRSIFDSKQKEILQAIKILESVEGSAQDSTLNYEILILASRAYLWKGDHSMGKAEKVLAYSKGVDKAKWAQEIDPTYADSYYYVAANLAGLGEAKGIFALVSRHKELLDSMNEVKSRTTWDGQSGNSMDGYGLHRILGRVYYLLPSSLGGSYQKSIEFLQMAYKQAPHYPINSVYFAEALSTGSDEDKQLAKLILDQLLMQDPTSYSSKRLPENFYEFELARTLRLKLGG